ncbi:beta-lactamase family protein [Roseomonas sp. OT10]|uniref:serine hydrolase domain-containing protein n=1 Tax=Roseomonas cutis TaxID=2897332 RepID=UPI001E5A0F56|nr:serine hydrolase domain-containing protein [Roseomonas sp. OT10]UFN50597.1 beta-lactamase family protein [Roseomonas sp. OT10]
MTTPDRSRAAAAAAAIADAWSEAGGPGGALVLFDAQGVREAAAGGLASLEHRLPFTPDSVGRWASISKHLCAATLLAEGFDLHDTYGRFVPGLDRRVAAVPLRQGLAMTGGIPDLMETMVLAGLPYSASWSEAELLETCRLLPGLNNPPGGEMIYSNTGWRLAQASFPAARGTTYAEALRDRLLAPLDLDIRFPEDETVPVADLATGYWREAGGPWRRGRYGLHFSASGGLAGSTATLARWGSALLAGRGPLAGMLERLAPEAGGFYGLGLAVTPLGGLRLLGHGGSLPGYKNHLLFSPELGIGVAVLCNQEEAEPLWLALRVLSAWTGEPLPAPGHLPAGLYAEEEGSAWAESTGEALVFMGAQNRLTAGPGGTVEGLSGSLALSLRAAPDGALEGRIGGVPRRLLRVPDGVALDPALTGRWREPAFGGVLEVREDGTVILPGHPMEPLPLTPLPGRRALASRQRGPWRSRPCLWLAEPGRLRLAVHRSRVLEFRAT